MLATLNHTAPRLTATFVLCALMVAQSFAAANEPPSSAWSPPTEAAGEELPGPGLDVTTDLPVQDDWVLTDDIFLGDQPWYRSVAWLDSPWDSGLELGLNGSTGTSESFSIRTGGYVKLRSRFSKFDFNTYYNRTTAGGFTTQNNAKMDVRNDCLLDDSSPWTLFALGSLFYDQFQVFDMQTNANSGIGYKIADFPDLEITTRIGAGASREFGGVNDRWKAEALFGFEYEQKLSDRQTVTCKAEYFPEMEQMHEFRLVVDAGYEVALDKPSNLSLKFSVNDRYDSTPNGAEAHLVNYSALLLWKL